MAEGFGLRVQFGGIIKQVIIIVLRVIVIL